MSSSNRSHDAQSEQTSDVSFHSIISVIHLIVFTLFRLKHDA